MTVLHTGSNNTYSERWQSIFGDKKNAKSATKRASTTKSAAKAKGAKKAPAKRKSK